MTVYTVHLPDEAPSEQARLLRAELVKDGFHWWAFLLPFLWLLFNRIWWGLLAYIAVVVAVALLGRAVALPPEAAMGFDLLVNLFVALVAGDLKAWQLQRRGYRMVDVVSGRDEDEAERRFYDRAALRRVADPASRTPAPAIRAGGVASPGGVQPVLGLFPEAGGSR